MTPVGLAESLAERVREVVARSELLAARSVVLVDASRYARRGGTYVPRCAWCGKVELGGVWLEHTEVPAFVRRAISHRSTDGICPVCFSEQLDVSSHEVSVHAGNRRAADCLAGELHEYGVRQRADHVLAVPVPPRDDHFVSDLLTRLAECLDANALDPIRVRIGGHSYLLAGR